MTSVCKTGGTRHYCASGTFEVACLSTQSKFLLACWILRLLPIYVLKSMHRPMNRFDLFVFSFHDQATDFSLSRHYIILLNTTQKKLRTRLTLPYPTRSNKWVFLLAHAHSVLMTWSTKYILGATTWNKLLYLVVIYILVTRDPELAELLKSPLSQIIMSLS